MTLPHLQHCTEDIYNTFCKNISIDLILKR